MDNPLRILGRVFGLCAAVLNDPEVQEAGDSLFGAMERATKRYELTAGPVRMTALEGGTHDGT